MVLKIHCALALVAGFFVLPSRAFAEDYPAVFPNVTLPKQVIAPPGKLTMFADYQARTPRGVPIYLVNRTDAVVQLPHWVFENTKLEHRLNGGVWERAEPLVLRCGNDGLEEFQILLPAGQHFKWTGYMPRDGEAAKVRYRMSGSYGEVTSMASNEGDGMISPEAFSEEQAAMTDNEQRMLLDFVTQSSSVSINGKPVPPAMIVATARLLQVGGAYPLLKELLADTASSWEKKQNPSEDEKLGAKALRELLRQPWPRYRDPEALLARCIEAMASSEKDKGEFGRPEENLGVVWNALNGLRLSSMEPQRWKPLVDFAQKREDLKIWGFIAIIFAQPGITDEFLTDDFLRKHLDDPSEEMKKLCKETLAQRKKGPIYAPKSGNQ